MQSKAFSNGMISLLALVLLASSACVGSATPTSGQSSAPPRTPTATGTFTAPLVSTSTTAPVPAAVSRQMDAIEGQVELLRGLSLKRPIDRALLTTGALAQRVQDDFLKDYTQDDAKKDSVVLSAFGLLPKGFDLRGFLLKLYAEQVAGFYDSKTKEMYVVQDKGFGGVERMTYAHETVHALQDQTYDLENGMKMNNDYCYQHTEYCGAVQALVEGDASLIEQLWFGRYATEQDKQDVQSFYQSYSSPVYDSAPEYLKQDFLFPYNQGLNFVTSLVQKGGYGAVDAAFKNPPVSTEQILHPDRYPQDTPRQVDLPDFSATLGTGWQEIDRNVLGEWYTDLVLSAGKDPTFRLDTTVAAQAAEGWGGDSYVVYQNSSTGGVALVWESVWDTEADRQQFLEALQTYAADRWEPPSAKNAGNTSWDHTADGAIQISTTGQSVALLIAPQPELLSRLGQTLAQP